MIYELNGIKYITLEMLFTGNRKFKNSLEKAKQMGCIQHSVKFVQPTFWSKAAMHIVFLVPETRIYDFDNI